MNDRHCINKLEVRQFFKKNAASLMFERRSLFMKLSKMIARNTLCSLLLLNVACGRYGDPQPPEFFAPQGVNNLQVTADLNGVLLKWEAPEQDRRGEALKSIDGYFVNRRIISKASDLLDPDIEDEVLGTVLDTHLQVLKDLRQKAIEEGKISRKVSVDEALKRFSYVDSTVKPGVTYLYSIVPFNQGRTEGLVPLKAKVLFRGDSSVVTMIETEEADLKKFTGFKKQKNTLVF
ncbi:MAG: hypothetical protein ACOX2O_02255 [Bdellovibrionota bacterium]|jgi:hypothetical protein